VRLYVYYRVATRDAHAAVPCALRLQALLAAGLGVSGELLRRQQPDEAGIQTWMEVYELGMRVEVQEFDRALAEALAGSGLAAYLQGDRHIERFVAFPSPSVPA
jgi:hypothetical protein